MGDTLAFLNIGAGELLLILLIALLLFGSRKLPELARSLGSSMKEVRKGLSDTDNDSEKTQKQSKDEAQS